MEKNLINELTQGKELTEQLRNHLTPESPDETRQVLVDKILSSYQKVLSMLNWSDFGAETNPNATGIMQESPHSNIAASSPSPRSDITDKDFKDQAHRDVFKKRKTQPRWTEQVRICSDTGTEGPLDDGYSWRKYGQKDILGAAHPRGYYRCTHRNSQGCLAIKQVQRSDEDPSIYEVTYRGRHTCVQSSHHSGMKNGTTSSSQIQNHCNKQQERKNEKPKPSREASFNFGQGLQVKTEDLDSRPDEDIFTSFTFSSMPIGDENGDNIFMVSTMDNNFLGSLSPAFISPATSDSNYFSMSPCHMSSFGMGYNVPTPESDLAEIISAPTSVTNSPIGDLDISSIDDFDANFPFDNPELFAC